MMYTGLHPLPTREGQVSRRNFVALLTVALGALSTGLLSGCEDVNHLFGEASANCLGWENGLAGQGPAQGGGLEDVAVSGNSCTVSSERLSTSTFLFGTVVTLSAACDQETLQGAVQRCEYFDQLFSRHAPNSDVWRINHAEGKAVRVSPETAQVIEASLMYSKMTDGRFDITIGGVTELWDFVEQRRPSDEALAEAIKHVGYEGIMVLGTQVQLADPETQIDLGGIAKGFIADDLAAYFKEHDCQSAVINLGGNVYVVGKNAKGRPWGVGIKDPNNPGGDAIAVIEGEDLSVVTSGVYERSFTEEGVLYHHILDPQTGYPAATDVIAVSVATASSMAGDALSTSLFLLGSEKAKAWLDQHPEVDGLLVCENGDVIRKEGSRFVVRRA